MCAGIVTRRCPGSLLKKCSVAEGEEFRLRARKEHAGESADSSSSPDAASGAKGPAAGRMTSSTGCQEQNTKVLAERYRALGGHIKALDQKGGHMVKARDVQTVADFVIAGQTQAANHEINPK